MTIGDKIKGLRKDRGVTQEKLAEYLNITYQSVSKWENNTSLPDISLIVPIANFFGVTTDEILGVDTKKENAIKEFDEKSQKLRTDGFVRENYELWRSAAQIYPNDFHILDELVNALFHVSCSSGFTDDERKNARTEGIALCNRILEDCTDNEIRLSITQTLIYLYINDNNEEMAIKTAVQAPHISYSRQCLLEAAYNYDNPERPRLIENNRILFAEFLTSNMLDLSKSNAEIIQACYAILNIWNILFYDGNFLFFHLRIMYIYQKLAWAYALEKDKQATIEALQKAEYHARQSDSLPDKETPYTGIFFSHLTYKKQNTCKNYKESHIDVFRQYLNQKCFDFVRNDEEFKSLYIIE